MTEPAQCDRPLRLTVVCTGSVNAANLPWWIAGLRLTTDDVDVRVVVTRSAARFVSLDALSVISGRPALLDAWPDGAVRALHVDLVEWSDAFAVYPATAHSIARLAHGMTDTPSMLALQSTRAPIVVAPALPEGILDSPALRRNLAALAEWENLTLAAPVKGRSWTTGRDGAAVPPPLPHLVDDLRRRLAEADPRRDPTCTP